MGAGHPSPPLQDDPGYGLLQVTGSIQENVAPFVGSFYVDFEWDDGTATRRDRRDAEAVAGGTFEVNLIRPHAEMPTGRVQVILWKNTLPLTADSVFDTASDGTAALSSVFVSTTFSDLTPKEVDDIGPVVFADPPQVGALSLGQGSNNGFSADVFVADSVASSKTKFYRYPEFVAADAPVQVDPDPSSAVTVPLYSWSQASRFQVRYTGRGWGTDACHSKVLQRGTTLQLEPDLATVASIDVLTPLPAPETAFLLFFKQANYPGAVPTHPDSYESRRFVQLRRESADAALNLGPSAGVGDDVALPDSGVYVVEYYSHEFCNSLVSQQTVTCNAGVVTPIQF
jgi:hypothetical protein